MRYETNRKCIESGFQKISDQELLSVHIMSCPVKSCHQIARIVRHHYELGMIKATSQILGLLGNS